MLLATAALILGFILLVWSADYFVNGAAATARNLGMSPMLIGLTIVSIGTSAPEILVSLMAALSGHGNLAVGNALGSNIANIALVLGITLLIAPLPVNMRIMGKELPLLTVITLGAGLVLMDQQLAFMESLLMLGALVTSLLIINHWQKNQGDDEPEEEIPTMSQTRASICLVVGLGVLLGSSHMLVWSATEIARFFGISELVIGLTVVAIGTSLPELAACVASALKKHHDIALGNIVGSNIFNILAVMAVPGLVTTTAVEADAFTRDFPIMAGLTLLLLAMALIGGRPKVLGRAAGLLLTSCYIGYIALIYTQA